MNLGTRAAVVWIVMLLRLHIGRRPGSIQVIGIATKPWLLHTNLDI